MSDPLAPRSCVLVLLLVLVAVSAAPNEGSDRDEAAAKGVEILFIHNNDLHARFEQTNRLSGQCPETSATQGECYGGYARHATLIKQARRDAASGAGPAVVVLNAGDTYQGSIYFTVFKWRVAVNFTNLLGFDAMSLGNHEFDDGVAGLLPFISEVNAPQVCANLDMQGAPAMQPFIKPSVVLDVAGTKVGVIGYITPDTAFLSKPDQVKFVDEIEAISAEAARLKAAGVNIIVALGHSGYPMDKLIAEKVADVDLVVGGHSHSLLWTGTPPDVDVPVGDYPTFVRQASGREVPVVQAYAYSKYLGRLTVKFDADGEIRSRADVQGSPVLLDKSVEQDPDVLRELETWRVQLDAKVNEPLGKTLTLLDGDCRARECNFGNFIADALVHYRAVRYQGPGWTDAPIGIQNGGNIRSSIDTDKNGSVTLRDVMEACPYENDLVVVQVRGSVLLQVLEQSVAGYDITGQYNKGAFLQFSGLHVTYDVSAPSGQRVVSASARCGNCPVPVFSPVAADELYGVITNAFLVDGGDGYSMLSDQPSTALADIVPYTAMAEYLRDLAVVHPDVDGRITLRGMDGNGKSSAPPIHTTSHKTFGVVLLFICTRVFIAR